MILLTTNQPVFGVNEGSIGSEHSLITAKALRGGIRELKADFSNKPALRNLIFNPRVPCVARKFPVIKTVAPEGQNAYIINQSASCNPGSCQNIEGCVFFHPNILSGLVPFAGKLVVGQEFEE